MKTECNFIFYTTCLVYSTDSSGDGNSDENISSNDVASALCHRNLVQVGVNKNLYTSYLLTCIMHCTYFTCND